MTPCASGAAAVNRHIGSIGGLTANLTWQISSSFRQASSHNFEKEQSKMLSLLRELAAYMSARKKWWLFPVIVVLVVVGGLLVLAQGSAIAPFIYTVF